MGNQAMWKLANFLWGDQDKPLGRNKGHPFLSCLVELASRGSPGSLGSPAPGGALGPVAPWHRGGGGCVFCPPVGIESSRGRGAPGAPQGQWGDPGACAPLGGTVLGVYLGFALAPGRPHTPRSRGQGAGLPWRRGMPTQRQDPQFTLYIGLQTRWEGAGC